MKSSRSGFIIGFLIALSVWTGGFVFQANAQVSPRAVIAHYQEIALAKYEDSLVAATSLKTAINALLADPGEKTLAAARQAWINARVPYSQSEAFRFGNIIVDDWEGNVNAWPLDEGLIDYVELAYGLVSDENSLYAANVIANTVITIDGKEVDSTKITTAFLGRVLHAAGNIDGNVAIGYHPIEFLLWGQDLNGTDKGGGERPYTDYLEENCSNNHCSRRRDYLRVVTDLLISDLSEMVGNWKINGPARKVLESGDEKAGLVAILKGMASMSYAEIAGERMKLGLMLNDQEEEQDSFSDNTHNSLLYAVLGVQNIYHGNYMRIDGTRMSGPSVHDLVKAKDEGVALELSQNLQKSVDAMKEIVTRAETVEAYDQMIGAGNSGGAAIVQAAIDRLMVQTESIKKAIATLELGAVNIEGSMALDNPDAVVQ